MRVLWILAAAVVVVVDFGCSCGFRRLVMAAVSVVVAVNFGCGGFG